MSRDDDLRRVLQSGIVAVVRSSTTEPLVQAARALAEGGVEAIEITMTVPGALGVLGEVRAALGDTILLGAGTVLDAESARAALLAGAEFVVSPIFNAEVIRLCHRYDRLAIPGCYSPTEILAAWEAGADVVKLFPADVGGPTYVKALRGPLPQVRLMPTGGVSLANAADFLAAGAACLGVGGALVSERALRERDFQRIREDAQSLTRIVREARRPR